MKEILDMAMWAETSPSQGYKSYRDGSHFKSNTLLTEEEFRVALNLYIDDFEVANPLGTSRKKHMLCLEVCTRNTGLPYILSSFPCFVRSVTLKTVVMGKLFALSCRILLLLSNTECMWNNLD